MVKKSKSKTKSPQKVKIAKANIAELQESRDGGEIALLGFTYQYLYSCYLMLTQMDNTTTFYLEGVEDIDFIRCLGASDSTVHIQLKYSSVKQDASFLKDVLKNFLEAYLIDKHRNFKLVYDFSIAKGHFSNLIDGTVDEPTFLYWYNIVTKIKNDNSHWNWSDFSFSDFLSKLSFENKIKDSLEREIEAVLIETYDIVTDNIKLFANSIKYFCLETMTQRKGICKSDLDNLIQSVKDDIAKGAFNPALGWIKKIDYTPSASGTDVSYYEGKKATPQDIANCLPVRRSQLEQLVLKSISKNAVTVIKASSGQGKTTMALQTCFTLLNEYTIYQLRWCSDAKELDNIVRFFKARIRLGEKPIILLDNLDAQLSEWNRLVQLFQEDICSHYKFLITAREIDWYNYGNDISNIKSMEVIKLTLGEADALEIFNVLQGAKKIHPTVNTWRKAWEQVSDRRLLIEYVYLLTHGEMLSDRISHQISQIGSSINGNIKCELLRLVCFADICGVRLSLRHLIADFTPKISCDISELLKSIENEFLIKVDSASKYIEGLHPVRSKHIVTSLHEFYEIDDTALQVLCMCERNYFPKLFSCLPLYITSKNEFYTKVVDALWNPTDLGSYTQGLRGLFSGSVMLYYREQKAAFDDANIHGGLFLLSSELSPFTKVDEFDVSISTLDSIQKTLPDNKNIKYLCELRDRIPKYVLSETDIHCFSEKLFFKLRGNKLFETIEDISSYSDIMYWIYNIDNQFNLSGEICLKNLWKNNVMVSYDALARIFYTCFCGNEKEYRTFVGEYIDDILQYLKEKTNSLRVYLSEDSNEIHVEYILLASSIKNANSESVSRLTSICRTLPIFNVYCADALKPTINMLEGYKVPDDAHKNIPVRNIVITFHQEFNLLWNKTLMSNYECDTILEWMEHWFSVRKNICIMLDKSSACVYHLLGKKKLGSLATEVDTLRETIRRDTICELMFPHEDRPFEEKSALPKGFIHVKSKYFSSIDNFGNQFYGFLLKKEDDVRLAMVNIKTAREYLSAMQNLFGEMTTKYKLLIAEHATLCNHEQNALEQIIMACLYYEKHAPNEYFSKYQVKAWYKGYYKQLLTTNELQLSALSENFKVIFPQRYLQDGILTNYPVIIQELDFSDEDMLLRVMCSCLGFAESCFDYLVLMSFDSHGKIARGGLKFSKSTFVIIQNALENDYSQPDGSFLPFPIDITPQIVDCFGPGYELASAIVTGYEGIDRIAELLWAYTKVQELLTDERDIQYRKRTEETLKNEILAMLSLYKDKILSDDLKSIQSLCDRVIQGQRFGNDEMNKFCKDLTLVNDQSRPAFNEQ